MKILIIDIETTGFLKQGGKIVEVGIVELNLENGEKEILFDEVCFEHGITLKEIENSWIVSNSSLTVNAIKYSGSLESKRKRIQAILNDYPLGATAFNNDFDFGFMESRGFIFPKKLDCPMKLSIEVIKIPPTEKMIRAGFNKFKTPNVQEAWNFFFGINTGYVEKHRGADDAFHEADIVFELYKREIFKLNN